MRAAGWASRGLRSPARDMLLTSLTPPAAYGRAFGLERAGDNAGAVAGPLLAAGLVAWAGIRPALLIAVLPGRWRSRTRGPALGPAACSNVLAGPIGRRRVGHHPRRDPRQEEQPAPPTAPPGADVRPRGRELRGGALRPGRLVGGRRTETRVRAHVFLRMLSYYITWHMQARLAPLLFTDDDKAAAEAARPSPVAPAARSPRAAAKAAAKHTPAGLPVHSLTSLLADLATICLNQIQPADPALPGFHLATTPTPLQRQALDLLGVSHRLGIA